MQLFSQRNSDPPARFIYTLPEQARKRILHTLRQHQNDYMLGERYDFDTLLHEVREIALAKYGSLTASPYEAARMSNHPVIEHFFVCWDAEALEFVEMCFRTRVMGSGDDARRAVAAINEIFEEQGIGYELTSPLRLDTGKPATLFGRLTGGNAIRIEYPRIVRKGERTVHDLAVKPALETLHDPRFAVANSELLKAFEEVRKGDYADAITSCGSAFESVLKTVCTAKGWSFDPNSANCGQLVEVCRGSGLFPPLYAPILAAVGTVRNKMGDAHGKGPVPVHEAAGREHAEHMIAMTCTHIDFVVRLAAL